MAQTILVIEDEETIASAVAARLEKEGFTVSVAGDGVEGIQRFRSESPDLVVLDLMLPGMDGLEVCRRIQAERYVPVLMLTARNDETDVLVGLGVGADDYVTKPFSPRELVARVKALLRRVERAAAAPPQTIRAGDIEIDTGRRLVQKAGRALHLTPIEFELLQRFAARPGFVFTRDRLLNDVWGYDDPAGGRTVDTHVASLRRKLGSEVIRTVHGVGYALETGSPP
ncbi:MAG TPA: response regulator transcription factor [Actinomycetota bacterium]|nr:response regulator transcription factor [Actinomycetota bacterium]